MWSQPLKTQRKPSKHLSKFPLDLVPKVSKGSSRPVFFALMSSSQVSSHTLVLQLAEPIARHFLQATKVIAMTPWCATCNNKVFFQRISKSECKVFHKLATVIIMILCACESKQTEPLKWIWWSYNYRETTSIYSTNLQKSFVIISSIHASFCKELHDPWLLIMIVMNLQIFRSNHNKCPENCRSNRNDICELQVQL